MKKFSQLLMGLLASLLLFACNLSQVAQENTVTQTAPTLTFTPLSTSIEASTPTPAPTATSTATPPPTATPLTEPVTVHIASDGSGDFPSLEAAVEVLPGGSTLILAPGIYRLKEPLDIRQPLHLVGAGMDQTEIVSEAEGYVVQFSDDGPFTVEDLTFRHEGGAVADVVIMRIRLGEVSLARCRFTGAVSGEDEENRAGLRLLEVYKGFVQDCVAEGNDRVGILVEGIVTLERNLCSDNGIGILFQDDSHGMASENECTGNGAGIVVADQASPALKKNVCSNNEIVGIAYEDDASGTAHENRCEENGPGGVSLSGRANPDLTFNVVLKNKIGFAFLHDAMGHLSGNKAMGNGVGFLILDQARPDLFGNSCSFNEADIIVDATAAPKNVETNECEVDEF